MTKWIVLVTALLLREAWAQPTLQPGSTELPLETIAVTENSTAPVAVASTLAASTTDGPSTPPGDRCVLDKDCGEDDLYCEEGRCACKNLAAVLTKENTCIPAKRLGEECRFTEQCKAGEGDVSVCAHGICACHHGLFFMQNENGSSCVPGKDGEATQPRPPKPHIDPNMIIILAVLAIMFVGMCLALHLFSRSRFRNNRTIFNSPHPRLMHIKLGKKKKKGHRRGSSTLHVPASRQPSVCSQRSRAGSPAGSRRGSRVNSLETLKGPPPNTLNGQLGAPIAQLEDTSPITEDLKKDPWKNPGPDVVKEASVVQNGPNSPTIIVTHTSSGSRSPSTTELAPSPIARV